jgi:hypothetical protein
MLGVIAGFDEMDPTTIDLPVPEYTAPFKMRVSKLRLGLRDRLRTRGGARRPAVRFFSGS